MKKIKTVKELIFEFYVQNEMKLKDNYPGISPQILLSEYIQLEKVSESEGRCLSEKRIQEFLKGVPFAYLKHLAYFAYSSFYVNPDVLIPRSETELIIEIVQKFLKSNKLNNPSILEVGVGSGALLLSLCELIKTQSDVIGIDISSKAIEVALRNTFKNFYKLHQSPSWLLGDRFRPVLGKTFDIIVSNPPYIDSKLDLNNVHLKTHEYEPHLALYLDNAIYHQWFDEFLSDASVVLSKQGILVMEGHEDHLEEIRKLSQKYFSHSTIKTDYNERKRFLILHHQKANYG